MKLDEFISQTLAAIIAGVKRSHEMAEKEGRAVNPAHVLYNENNRSFVVNTSRGPVPDPMAFAMAFDFDVFKTIGEDDNSQGGVGMFAAALGSG